MLMDKTFVESKDKMNTCPAGILSHNSTEGCLVQGQTTKSLCQDHCRKGMFMCSRMEQRRRRISDPRISPGNVQRARLYSISSIFEEDRWVVQAQVQNRKRERYKQMCRMLALMLIPVVALVAVTAVLLSNVISKQSTTEDARAHVICFLKINSYIQSLQNESDATTSLLMAENNATAEKNLLKYAIGHTDETFQRTRSSECVDQIDTSFFTETLQRLERARRVVTENNRTSVHKLHSAINKYDYIVNILMNKTASLSLFSGDHSQIWRHLVATKSLSHASSAKRMQKVILKISFYFCDLSFSNRSTYTRLSGEIHAFVLEALAYEPEASQSFHTEMSAEQYISMLNISYKFEININDEQFYEKCRKMSARDKRDTLEYYASSFDKELDVIDTVHQNLSKELESSLQHLTGDTQKEIIIYSIMAAIVSVVCIWASLWYATCIQTLTHALSLYALKSSEKSKELAQEKRKTESLLYQMMPPTIANQLRDNREVTAEYYESVTICFSDIVGFTSLSAMSSPFQIVNLLNDLYSMFDEAIDQFDVYKVETIGDAYMVVSGLPEKNDNHTTEIADMSLDIRQAVNDFIIPHLPDKKLYIRIGFHTGSCMAGVVGTKMPRYCLFGDAVNVASRMESTSEAQKIQISQETRDVLHKAGTYILESRGEVDVKGKGVLNTYWLVGKDLGVPKRKTSFMIPVNVEITEEEPLMKCNGYTNYAQVNTLDPNMLSCDTIL